MGEREGGKQGGKEGVGEREGGKEKVSKCAQFNLGFDIHREMIKLKSILDR